jgi:hypothetical protein
MNLNLELNILQRKIAESTDDSLGGTATRG